MVAMVGLVALCWAVAVFGRSYQEAEDRTRDLRSEWRVKRETRLDLMDRFR